MSGTGGKKRRHSVLKGFIFFLYCLICVEIATRVFLFFMLNQYIDDYIPLQYRNTLRDVLNVRCWQGALDKGECEYDSFCYYKPKGTSYFRKGIGYGSFPKKKTEKIRIICLGDSTTYGIAVKEEQAWPYQLQNNLEKRYGKYTVEVLNAGIPGAYDLQLIRYFKKYLLDYKPDIVIWRKWCSEMTWDMLDEDHRMGAKARYFLWRGIFWFKTFRLLTVFFDIQPDPLYMIHQNLTYRYDHKVSLDSEWVYQFEALETIAENNDIPYVLIIDNLRNTDDGIYSDFEPQYYIRRPKNYVATLPAFKVMRENMPNQKLFVDKCHMTEYGHTIVADVTAHYIIANKIIETIKET